MTAETSSWPEPTREVEADNLAEVHQLNIAALSHFCRLKGIEVADASDTDLPVLTHVLHDFMHSTAAAPQVHQGRVDKNIAHYYKVISRVGDKDQVRQQKAFNYRMEMIRIAQQKAPLYPEIRQTFMLERALRPPDGEPLQPIQQAIHVLLAAYGERFKTMSGYSEHIARSMIRE